MTTIHIETTKNSTLNDTYWAAFDVDFSCQNHRIPLPNYCSAFPIFYPDFQPIGLWTRPHRNGDKVE